MSEEGVISSSLQRRVEPKGHLLSDNDSGVDHLGYSIYAEALAKLLLWVQTPITVGVFAPWGSGKSFLLREVRYLLQKYQNQNDVDNCCGGAPDGSPLANRRRRRRDPYTSQQERRKQTCSCAAWTFFLLSMICLLVATLFIALDPSMRKDELVAVYLNNETVKSLEPSPAPTQDPSVETERASIGFFAVVLLLSGIGIVFVVFVCCVVTTDSKCWQKTSRNFRLVAYSAFTTLPTLGEKRRTAQADYDIVIDFDEDADLALMTQLERDNLSNPMSRLQAKYIFVNFKAWEYAGSDTLWAGIVTNLTQAIEAEFGVVTSRLFRMLDIEEVSDDSKCLEPSTVRVQILQHDVRPVAVKRLMTQYGVVVDLERHGSWWTVRYSNSTEARNALKSLRIAGFNAHLADEPGAPRNSPNQNRVVESRNKEISIEMDSFVLNRPTSSVSISSRDIRRSVEPYPESFGAHFLKYPKKVCCGCPFLYFCILFVIALVLFPIGVCILVSELHLDILRSARAIPVEVQILAWMPATAAALVVIVRFGYAMFKSQTRRVNQALSGARGSMAAELGFMSKVKDEIKVIEKLVRCLRFTHQQNYKIVISIDDLDRCPHDKVKSVLEAVSILLSDRSSPFICLIALDSRVAVKCIEEGIGAALLKANVNGHDYLKKIINLPFCLPELGSRDKRRYMAGMMDQADRTKLVRIPSENRSPTPAGQKSVAGIRAGDVILSQLGRSSPNRIKEDGKAEVGNRSDDSASPGASSTSLGQDSVDGEIDKMPELPEREFLFKCRKFLHDDETIKYHLAGNPRNMKRIFNVISMTTQLIKSLEAQEKRTSLIQRWTQSEPQCENTDARDFTWRLSVARDEAGARDLVRWVILTDQWPYRMSYILQVIEDADQRSSSGRRGEKIEEEETLASIYKKTVVPEINASLKWNDETTLLSLDGDPDLFLGLLFACALTKERALQLKCVTINLDQALRQSIALYRSLVDLQGGVSGKKGKDMKNNGRGDRADE